MKKLLEDKNVIVELGESQPRCAFVFVFIFQVFITNGILADLVIVVAITDPTAKSKAHGISLFLVEEGMQG